MATYFVHHNGDGLSATTDPGTGGDWSGAYAKIADALSAAAAGDIIKCSNLHAFSGAWAAWTAVGTLTSIVFIDSVDHNDTSVSSTGAKESYNSSTSTFTGVHRIRGLIFEAITNSNGLYVNNSNSKCDYENCTFDLKSGFSFVETRVATTLASETTFKDCKFIFSNVSQEVWVIGKSYFLNCQFAPSATVPTVPLLQFTSGGLHKFVACDFSNYAQTTLFTSVPTANSLRVEVLGCKLNASTTTIFPSVSTLSRPIEFYYHTYNNKFKDVTTGRICTDDNTVVKNGGVGWSIKTVTSNSLRNFVNVGSFHLDLATNKTIEVEIAQYNAGGAPPALTNQECKLEVVSPNTTTPIIGAVVSSTTISSSTQRWDDDLGTEISTNITKQKLSVTVSGASGLSGVASVMLVLIKNGVTVNTDPSPTIT